jgi:hypothetical protein
LKSVVVFATSFGGANAIDGPADLQPALNIHARETARANAKPRRPIESQHAHAVYLGEWAVPGRDTVTFGE